MEYDVIIVGSGPAGVNTAKPLIKAGLKVAIADSQLGILKIEGNTKITQRLGKGGFSEVWFGISDFFTKEELELTGLPVKEMRSEYDKLAKEFNLKTPDQSKSLYEPPIIKDYKTSRIIDKFIQLKNFSYLPECTVSRFRENSKNIEVQTKKGKLFCKYLILAAGAVNTSRIVLQSSNQKRTPYLTKPNYILICLNIGNKIGPNQKVYLNHKAKAESRTRYFIQFYIPFAYKKLLSKFLKILVIADIRFPSFPSKDKYLYIKNKKFSVHVTSSKEELEEQKTEVSRIKKMLSPLGLIPLKTLHNRISSHYAGGTETDSIGKLKNFKRVYISDSASWKALPAKPITLTIMANAARVGKHVLDKYESEK